MTEKRKAPEFEKVKPSFFLKHQQLFKISVSYCSVYCFNTTPLKDKCKSNHR